MNPTENCSVARFFLFPIFDKIWQIHEMNNELKFYFNFFDFELPSEYLNKAWYPDCGTPSVAFSAVSLVL